jgi:hypothetical protein
LVGRFITRDPISYGGGINLYSYVTNRTPNAIDPSGLERLNYTLQPGQPPPPIPTNPVRLPDFFSGQVNVGLGPLVPFGWSGQVILDRKGNLYLQPLGFNGGKSFTFVSGAITAGWINQRCEPSERELGNVLNDQSIGGGGGFIGGVEFTANKSGSTTQVGAMSPQIGGSWGHTTKVGNLGIGW